MILTRLRWNVGTPSCTLLRILRTYCICMDSRIEEGPITLPGLPMSSTEPGRASMTVFRL